VNFRHLFPDVHLLSGGVLFGGTYMITDPVTMPITRPSRVIYGMVVAVSVVFIRLFGSYAEGMGFSILIGNMFAPVMDHYKWSTNKYTWKNLLAMGIIAVLAIRHLGLGAQWQIRCRHRQGGLLKEEHHERTFKENPPFGGHPLRDRRRRRSRDRGRQCLDESDHRPEQRRESLGNL
jgi:hypothetical protein